MKEIEVYHYDAFSTEPGKGNPAGIILNGDDLSTEEMQHIAKVVGFSECAFPIRSDLADIRIRYFTPGYETPLCGHATMASIAALLDQKILPEKENYLIETLAGVLPVNVSKEDAFYQIRMQHAKPQFINFEGVVEDLAQCLNIPTSAIDSRYPVVYGNTGQWTLCVPIKEVELFKQMKPQTDRFPDILKELPKSSIHPFSLKALNEQADLHARHFSSPYSGTIEDPVTGTASGVLGAYVATYIKPEEKEKYDIIVEQGQEMGKDGRVIVHIDAQDDLSIAISGTAVFVEEIKITI
ncbi:PhzF family phenazine biosynthesis protein [Sporosarcina sp. 179-K 3D1 HS]|uniref:PhzF family phenazine biosynthesis protein n=1 Tax=Sporosarcina sp. 179-K 3D1 HS TaxID=3232169 RepID=UPI00399F035B